MSTYRAIDERDGQLTWTERKREALPEGWVRIAVAATAVNRADLVQRRGAYAPPPGASPILGLEATGTVIEVAGEGRWQVGDRVCALLAGGGYATETCCPAAHCLPVPEGFDWVQAAAITEVFATAWVNLFHEAGLKAGERVLLHAGASGVGTAGIQLAREHGCRVFVTAGSAAKIARCVSLGADGGANRHDGPWLAAVRQWAPQGVDVLLDPVGGSYLADNQKALSDAKENMAGA